MISSWLDISSSPSFFFDGFDGFAGLAGLVRQDLAFARTVQLEEQRLAEQEAMQTRREAEHKLRLVNW